METNANMDSMQENDRHSTERLAQLVHQKSTLVRELHKLVSKQQQMIRDQEVDLIPLLAVKQRVLEALNVLDRTMDPFRQQDPDQRRWISLEARSQCRDEAEQCEALFRQVLMIENECTLALQKQQQKAREQLQGVALAGQASRAYQRSAGGMATPTSHLDFISEG
jgi:hypothetical protein